MPERSDSLSTLGDRAITFGGRTFETKKAAELWVRHVLVRNATIGEPLNGADLNAAIGLLEKHPRRDEKVGTGILNIRIVEGRGNRHFEIERTDGTRVDFSWLKCLSRNFSRADIRSALRDAVSSEIAAARKTAFEAAGSDGRIACPASGKWILPGESHVDHAPPWTFEILVETFLDSEGVGESDDLLLRSGRILGSRLRDPEMARRFVRFHNDRAELRVVSAETNVSRGQLDKKFSQETRDERSRKMAELREAHGQDSEAAMTAYSEWLRRARDDWDWDQV